jgi:hypothetical protein
MSVTEQLPTTEQSSFENHLVICEALSKTLKTYNMDISVDDDRITMMPFLAKYIYGEMDSVKFFTTHTLSKKNRISINRTYSGFHTIKLTPYPCNKISKVTLYMTDFSGKYMPVKTIEDPPTSFTFFDYPIFNSYLFKFSIGVEFSIIRVEIQHIGIERFMIPNLLSI